MAKPYKRKKISQMKRAFLKTMSCALAAKICECHPSTIAKYRNREGWIDRAQVRKLCKGGKTPTLTADIAIKLATGWRLHVEDADLCYIIGISTGQLNWWLKNDTKVTIVRTAKKVGPDGTPTGEETKYTETIGIHQLRARSWAEFEHSYMQKLSMIAEKAENEGDLATAARTVEWMLAKRMPKKFGDQPSVAVNVSAQANIVSMAEINLPLDVRKKILAQIRNRNELLRKSEE